MKKRFFIIILSSFYTFVRSATLTTERNDNGSIAFVDGLKETLRQNNDDYIERKSAKISVIENNVTNVKTKLERRKLSLRRVNFEDNFVKDYEYTDGKKTEQTTPSTFTLEVSERNSPNLIKSQRKHDNSKSIENGELSTNDNRELVPRSRGISDMIKKQKIQLGAQGEIFDGLPLKPKKEETKRSFDDNNEMLENNPMNEPIAKNALRWRFQTEIKDWTSIPKNRYPSPDQLDMAPAKGSKIEVERVHGRLCHRHILWPEGPKYDSKGVAYLKAHNNSRGDFAITSRPHLLLPRCCNCCKKSVLGCE